MRKTLLFLTCMALVGSCKESSEPEEDLNYLEQVYFDEDLSYQERIEEYRHLIDSSFKYSDESPIENKANFEGLEYFPVDTTFKVVANVSEGDKNIIQLLAGTEQRAFIKHSVLHFTLMGKNLTLQLLKDRDNAYFFLPFTDQTSGEQTYGAGRYLNIDFQEGDKEVLIDFNKAYHPYCAYNHEYSCPIPPIENDLLISIKAGEKL